MAEILETTVAGPVPVGNPVDPVRELRERRDARASQYWAAVRRLADGAHVAPSQLEKLAGDRTPQQVETDVSLVRERNALRNVIAAAEPAARRADELRAALRGANERFEAARRERDEVLRRARGASGVARAAAEQAVHAEARLVASCPDESLRARLAALTGERAELVSRLESAADLDERGALEARAAELATEIECTRREMAEF